MQWAQENRPADIAAPIALGVWTRAHACGFEHKVLASLDDDVDLVATCTDGIAVAHPSVILSRGDAQLAECATVATALVQDIIEVGLPVNASTPVVIDGGNPIRKARLDVVVERSILAWWPLFSCLRKLRNAAERPDARCIDGPLPTACRVEEQEREQREAAATTARADALPSVRAAPRRRGDERPVGA